MTRVKGKNDVPTGQHYAILVYKSESVYIEGDERSRTSPGHGYPAHTEVYESFEHYVTQDKNEWLKAVEEFAKDKDCKDKFICFEVPKLATVKTKIVVEFEE
jgi:hypothetical protein